MKFRIGAQELDGAVLLVTGETEVAVEGSKEEWTNVARFVLLLAADVEAMNDAKDEDERSDAFRYFCSTFGLFALTHQDLVERAAAVTGVRAVADEDVDS